MTLPAFIITIIAIFVGLALTNNTLPQRSPAKRTLNIIVVCVAGFWILGVLGIIDTTLVARLR